MGGCLFCSKAEGIERVGTEGRGQASVTEYRPMDPLKMISTLEARLLQQAFLFWVCVPIFVVVCSCIPAVSPSCQGGFHDATLVVLLVAEVQHFCAERSAWSSLRNLLSPGEVLIMRQLGVLRRRLLGIIVGTLEGLDIYTDLAFTFIARSCGEEVTRQLAESWRGELVVGRAVAAVLYRVEFWGIVLIVCATNLLLNGVLGLLAICYRMKKREQWLAERARAGERFPRISGEIFFNWAHSSATAFMPSVTMLCEAMADQSKWMYKPTEHAPEASSVEDARTRESTKARYLVAMGKMVWADLELLGISDRNEKARVELAERRYFIRTLLLKVLLGNVLMFWLQAQFFAVMVHDLGTETSVKVGISMALSAVISVYRCVKVTVRIGTPGLTISFVILLLFIWSGLKVAKASSCEKGQVWTLTSGCVSLGRRR